MAEVTVTRALAESPDAVWAHIGDFTRPDWLPGVTVAEVSGEGPGARRVLEVPGGGRLVEHLLEVGERRMTWATVGSPMPMRDALTTLAVEPAPGGAEVRWTVTFESAGPPEERVALALRGMAADLLAAI